MKTLKFLIAAAVMCLLSTTASADSKFMTYNLTIASGASLSDAIDLNDIKFQGTNVARIKMPSTWTAANLAIHVSEDCSTYVALRDGMGLEYIVYAAASYPILLDPAVFKMANCIKLESVSQAFIPAAGTTATAINQAGARTITLFLSK